jgi:predicted MFS family arabinose efflux permease
MTSNDALTAAALGTGSRGRSAQASTRIIFFIAGISMAAWAPLVPFVKARGDLSAGALGALLLCLGVGSILALPLGGLMCSRFGCRAVIVSATAVICLALPILAVASYLPLLIVTLFLFGSAVASVDCAMNIQAIIVERASGHPMMSGFHGLFSVGGVAAAAGVSLLLLMGTTPLMATLGVVLVIIASLGIAAPHLLAEVASGHGPALALPRGVVLFIGGLCFICFLTEGAALDWSAVFLTSVRHIPAAYAGLGYAAFAAAMTIGRLSGDRIVKQLGARPVIVGGALCAVAGLALATLAPGWEASIAGYALVGAGCSNIVPVLYTAAGRQTAMPHHAAISAITTMGYAGILIGPAAIGFVAHASSLSAALLAVALLLVGVAAGGRMLRV